MTTPTRQFANDDEAAQHWLILLRDGDADQKIAAREQLAAVFERRGMLEEAADLLASNVRDGVRSADIFRWLARLYRAQGDEVTAMQAAAEAAKYLRSAGPPIGSTLNQPSSATDATLAPPYLPPQTVAPTPRKSRTLRTVAVLLGEATGDATTARTALTRARRGLETWMAWQARRLPETP